MRGKYATVKIPLELAMKLDPLISDLGYRSRAEIVNDAIRRFIDERKRLEEATQRLEVPRPTLQGKQANYLVIR